MNTNNENNILSIAYPIGAIYMSVNSVNPSELFGGTWEQIQDRFLIGASANYPIMSQGGEANHTLTTGELPSHSHANSISVSATQTAHRHSVWGSKTHGGYGAGIRYSTGVRGFAGAEADNNTEYNEKFLCGTYAMETATPTISVTSSINNSSTGSGLAHNNMPPYLAVYIWKRIA